MRTALCCSFYALTIVKIFDKSFSLIGLAFAILALLILGLSFLRRQRLNHDFADLHFPEQSNLDTSQARPRIWGRDYRTPGDFVLVMAAAVAAIQISLMFIFFGLK